MGNIFSWHNSHYLSGVEMTSQNHLFNLLIMVRRLMGEGSASTTKAAGRGLAPGRGGVIFD